MAKKQKYYVVWKGHKKGVFDSWQECQKGINGFAGALYKSFDSKIEAEFAFKESPQKHIYKNSKNEAEKNSSSINLFVSKSPIMESISTDAACSGNPGIMEYQGVSTRTRKRLFHYKYPCGTNNIGEFLGLVHGLSYLKKYNLAIPIYTDSVNAIKWVTAKKCKTKLERKNETEELFQYIERAEKWLKENDFSTSILKWDTKNWGEIPADFGRK